MITTLVQIKFSSPISREKAKAAALASAPKYREVSGLLRKYYIIAEDGTVGGGV